MGQKMGQKWAKKWTFVSQLFDLGFARERWKKSLFSSEIFRFLPVFAKKRVFLERKMRRFAKKSKKVVEKWLAIGDTVR